jgi:hypothetical protein
MSDALFKRWMCLGCGFLYDEALGARPSLDERDAFATHDAGHPVLKF